MQGSQALKHLVLVGSKNAVKVKATHRAFRKAFPNIDFEVKGVAVASSVPDQPVGDEQTLLGATNRVAALSRENKDACFLVGIEGGVGPALYNEEVWECFAWAVVRSRKSGKDGRARSASFQLPPALTEYIKQDLELGEADDSVFERRNSGSGGGTVGYLTSNVITREKYYEHAIFLSLIPFLNPKFYKGYEW